MWCFLLDYDSEKSSFMTKRKKVNRRFLASWRINVSRVLVRNPRSLAYREVSERVAARILQAGLIDFERLISNLVPFPGLTFPRCKPCISCPDLASMPPLAGGNFFLHP